MSFPDPWECMHSCGTLAITCCHHMRRSNEHTGYMQAKTCDTKDPSPRDSALKSLGWQMRLRVGGNGSCLQAEQYQHQICTPSLSTAHTAAHCCAHPFRKHQSGSSGRAQLPAAKPGAQLRTAVLPLRLPQARTALACSCPALMCLLGGTALWEVSSRLPADAAEGRRGTGLMASSDWGDT